MQVPLHCKGNGVNTKNAKAAYLGRVGASLAASMGIPVDDDILYVVFEQKSKSSLCIYSMKSIEQKFTENIKSCFEGDRRSHFTGQCIQNNTVKIDNHFCGFENNFPLLGSQVITAVPTATFDMHVRTIIVTAVLNLTVAFIGTDDLYVKKVSIETETSAVAYAHIQIGGHPHLRRYMRFDSDESHVYIISAYSQILKISNYNCSLYSAEDECVSSKDPYCRWCAPTNKCSLRSECPLHSPSNITYKTKECMLEGSSGNF